MDHRLLNLEKGRFDVVPSYDEIKDYQYSPAEWERVLHNRGRMITGTPPQVKEQLLQLADDYEVDEIVIATITDHFEDRLRSYELLAGLFL